MVRQAAADINNGSCSMDKCKCAKATLSTDQHADNVVPLPQGLTASALMTSPASSPTLLPFCRMAIFMTESKQQTNRKLSQQASGACNAVQLPRDRLVLGIPNLVVLGFNRWTKDD